uniref:FBA_2 domain-containing protein n=1 Tax=Steinernema glaseri TaxID=37863 RepID=A0A1I8ATR1_9BILA
MDTVTLKFVDSVVELFGKDTLDQLAREVRHRHWKDVVDLHNRKRVYYEVYFRKEEDGIKHVFRNGKAKWMFQQADPSINMRTIRGKGRFTRIVNVSDLTKDRYLFNWDEVETLGEAETSKLLETVAPLIDPASGDFYSGWNSTDCTRWLLTSLCKRVHLQKIIIPYCGQIAYDFLEDQINNSPSLSDVTINGGNWPKSILDLMAKFCLKGCPRKRVNVTLSNGGETLIDSSYIQHLLDLWKENGNLYFDLCSFEHIADKKGLLAVMNKGKVTQEGYKVFSFFQHDTEKSVAVLSNDGYLMRCYTCECDMFEWCLLKNDYPDLHDF